METSWYLLHISPPPKDEEENDRSSEEQEVETPEKAEQRSAKENADKEAFQRLKIPQVGTPICHFLGVDAEYSERDKQNVLWDKIQDGVRPAWAPDLMRLGYSVVFKREGLPKLAVKLGIKNPVNVTKEDRRRSRNRTLTFDDVLVMGCVPHMKPMYFPDKDLDAEEWWLATKESRRVTSPYLAPRGCTVATGAQRLADVVIQMLRSPSDFPRYVPTMDDDKEDFSEFMNPLVPILPKGPSDHDILRQTRYGGHQYGPKTGFGWAGLELYRYGSTY
jgi:hypothetical protein